MKNSEVSNYTPCALQLFAETGPLTAGVFAALIIPGIILLIMPLIFALF
jgi:hypothetical protein